MSQHEMFSLFISGRKKARSMAGLVSRGGSVVLRDNPEDLHGAVVAVGEGDVVGLGYLAEDLRPVVWRFIRQALEQGGLGLLCGLGVDDLLDALRHQLIGAGLLGGGGLWLGHGMDLYCMCIQYIARVAGEGREGAREGGAQKSPAGGRACVLFLDQSSIRNSS